MMEDPKDEKEKDSTTRLTEDEIDLEKKKARRLEELRRCEEK